MSLPRSLIGFNRHHKIELLITLSFEMTHSPPWRAISATVNLNRDKTHLKRMHFQQCNFKKLFFISIGSNYSQVLCKFWLQCQDESIYSRIPPRPYFHSFLAQFFHTRPDTTLKLGTNRWGRSTPEGPRSGSCRWPRSGRWRDWCRWDGPGAEIDILRCKQKRHTFLAPKSNRSNRPR